MGRSGMRWDEARETAVFRGVSIADGGGVAKSGVPRLPGRIVT